MIFTDAEAEKVKEWVIRKLDDISDADSDVLADYVLALIRTDAPDTEIVKACLENLEDFLRENTQTFVDQLFAYLNARNGNPTAPIPQVQHTFSPTAKAFNPPIGPKSDFNSRKRAYNDEFQPDQGYGNGAPQDRAFKTPRRGRGGGDRGGWMGGGVPHMQPGAQQFPGQQPGFPMMPGMPGFPAFDQNDPMASMMQMQQQMGFPQMPGMPPMAGQPGMEHLANERCPFYDTQGICYLGAACPYKHGDAGAKNDEYDPKTAAFMHRNGDSSRGGERGRGRGRGGNGGGRGRGRSDFSSAGPNEDRSITTIVVEQIPEDKFNEDSIREFFSQFGNITEISLQPFKNLALVKFETFPEAKQAWSSPKVIFDNRFVKVYWFKPKPNERGGDGQPEAPPFDPEEFERQQQLAQKAHEEKMQKRQETERAREELERQREELMKKQQEEKARLMERLGMTSADVQAAADAGSGIPADDENASEETKQLRAQLAALEAEAQTLGIDPSSPAHGGYRGRGRGRGRGGFRGRGGYDPSYRGGRGRGGFAPRGRGGVLRLDNRPRRVAVTGVELNSDKDEALRQHLMGIGDYESIEANPAQGGSVIVAFKERYQAEKFMYSPRNITNVGEVEFSWVPNPPITLPAAAATPEEPKNGMVHEEQQDTVMESEPAEVAAPAQPARDMDYDVAEDDSWGA